MNGDSFLDINLGTADTYAHTYNKPVIYGCCAKNTAQYGRIEYINNLITKFTEKKTAQEGIINAGIYVFPHDILENIPKLQPFSIEHDFFSLISSKDKFRLIVSSNNLIDIGTPELLKSAQTKFRIDYPELLT